MERIKTNYSSDEWGPWVYGMTAFKRWRPHTLTHISTPTPHLHRIHKRPLRSIKNRRAQQHCHQGERGAVAQSPPGEGPLPE